MVGLGPVAGELGHGLLGAVVVDQGLAGSGGGDECGDGGVVERARQAQAGFVESSDGIFGNERIGAADQRQVMTQVVDRLAEIHGRDLVPRGDPLIERGAMSIST